MEKKQKINFKSFIMVAALLVIWIILLIVSKGSFMTPRNMSNLLRQMSVVGLLAIGMVYVLLLGNIDLSVGSFVTLGGVICACLMVYNKWATVPAIIVVLVCGLVLGLIHGLICTQLKVPAFICTLGTQMILNGLVLAIGKGVSIAPMNENYKVIGQGNIPAIVCYILAVVAIVGFVVISVSKRASQKKLGLPMESPVLFIGKLVIYVAIVIALVLVFVLYEGMPVPFLLLVVFTLVLQFIAENTKIGRHMYAVGGNRQAALCSGINIVKTEMFTYLVCSFMAAVAAIVMSSRLNCGSATSGTGKELDAIAGSVIGGVSLNGGRGRVMGAILGALIMASLDNGMSLLNIEAFWQYIVKGLILIVAVGLDTSSAAKKGK